MASQTTSRTLQRWFLCVAVFFISLLSPTSTQTPSPLLPPPLEASPPPSPTSSSFWSFNFNFRSASSSPPPFPPPRKNLSAPTTPTPETQNMSPPPPRPSTRGRREPSISALRDTQIPPPSATKAPAASPSRPPLSKGASPHSVQVNGAPRAHSKEPRRSPPSPGKQIPRSKPKSLIPAIFSFGDANVNTGNDNFRNDTPLHADFPPNGRTFFRRPTGRVTDGRLIPDFLCQFLGIPFLPPYLDPRGDFKQGACFATGGSSATNNSLEPGWGYPLSKQVDLFLQLHGNVSAAALLRPPPPPSFFPFSLPNPFPSSNRSSAPYVSPSLIPRLPSEKTLSEALYYIQIGEVNFLQLTYQAEGFGENAARWMRFVSPRVQADVLSSTEDAIARLYNAGARKFLVFAVYPQACNPLVRGRANLTTLQGKCVTYAEPMVEQYNEALSRMLWDLRARLNKSSILLSRADKVFKNILNGPMRYGFSPNLDPCCEGGNFEAYSTAFGGCGQEGYTVCPMGERRVFWDLVHNTEAVSYVVAKETWGGAQYVHPFNLSSLAYGYRSV